jgi:predicted O-methyltransferase YrrM
MEDIRGTIKSELATGDLRTYVDDHAASPHPYLDTIRQRCLQHKWNFMLTTPDQAAFLYTHAKMIGASKIFEIGTYYGHSTLALAAALPEAGRLISLEHNPKFATIAKEHMETAGVSAKVEIRVGEAPLLIPDIEAEHKQESFDLVFVDADKRHFKDYWEASLRLVRKGGVIIFDNALARGEILNESPDAPDHIAAVRAFNDFVKSDKRVFSYIATLADGMLTAIKL